MLAVLSLLSEMGDWKLVAYELSARHDGKYDERGGCCCCTELEEGRSCEGERCCADEEEEDC